MVMKRLIIIMFCLCAYQFRCAAQINLVPNSSFEILDTCPFIQNQIYFAHGWNSLDSTTDWHGNCKADYYNTCSNNLSPTNNACSHIQPKTGNADIATSLYTFYSPLNTDGRDYTRIKLHATLIINKSYCGKFYVHLLPNSYYAINKIGAYLDDGQLDTNNNSCLTPLDFVNAQIIDNNVLSDSSNWAKIESAFVANGTESFITLGCFKNHFNMQAVPFNTINNFCFDGGAAYLMDDVSIIDISTPAFAGTDALITNGDSVYLGRPNEIGPECRWWANGAVVDSNLGFWAKPTQPTQYVLEQKICGNVKYDTVFVNISGHDGIAPSLSGRHGVGLIPNPNKGNFTIKTSYENTDNVTYEIYTIDGKLLCNDKLKLNEGIANLNLNLAVGIYNVKIIGTSEITNHKLIITK